MWSDSSLNVLFLTSFLKLRIECVHLSMCELEVCKCARSDPAVSSSPTLYSILLIDLSAQTHTHTHSHICSRQAEIPPPIHRERARERGRERQIESWCVNGCSCLSHPGLFFGSLTQQSISSVLEGLVLDSSWHVPPSLRARDEGTCCAECSNTAYTHTHIHTHTHTHTLALWGEKKKTR